MKLKAYEGKKVNITLKNGGAYKGIVDFYETAENTEEGKDCIAVLTDNGDGVWIVDDEIANIEETK